MHHNGQHHACTYSTSTVLTKEKISRSALLKNLRHKPKMYKGYKVTYDKSGLPQSFKK